MPNAGYAAFATRRFQRGELICTEKPAVWIEGHHPFTEEQVLEIDRRIAMLPAEQQRAALSLANVFADAPTLAAGIFMTNSFDMPDSALQWPEPCKQAQFLGSPKSIEGNPSFSAESLKKEAQDGEEGDGVPRCALYVAIARLNHSCTPNAQQSHIPSTGEEVLYATRTIEEGEEINDCYIDLRQTTAERRAALSEIYRFHCTCKTCAAADNPASATTAAQDDRYRSKAATFDDLILRTISDSGVDTALYVALDAVRLLSAATCLPWSERYLPDAWVTVHDLYLAVAMQHKSRDRRDNFKNSKGRMGNSGYPTERSNSGDSEPRRAAQSAIATAAQLSMALSGPRSPEYMRAMLKLRAFVG